MTKKEMFTEIVNLARECGREDIVEFCNHEAELLAKRKSDNSKAKAEADGRANKVYKALAEMDKPVTITELLALTSDEEVASFTNQRVSALIRKLGEDKVGKVVNKGKSYFFVK